jgi:DNA polymerase eta
MLAELASGMNKPAQQTVVPSSSVEGLLESLPVKKIQGVLRGKPGTSFETCAKTAGDLLQFSEEKLQQCYGLIQDKYRSSNYSVEFL